MGEDEQWPIRHAFLGLATERSANGSARRTVPNVSAERTVAESSGCVFILLLCRATVNESKMTRITRETGGRSFVRRVYAVGDKLTERFVTGTARATLGLSQLRRPRSEINTSSTGAEGKSCYLELLS